MKAYVFDENALIFIQSYFSNGHQIIKVGDKFSKWQSIFNWWSNMDGMKYECLSCNKNCSNKNDEKSRKRFKNTLKFPNHINQFILTSR